MTRPRLALLSTVLVLLTTTVPATAVEYQINFRDGTSLRTRRLNQVAGQIRYEKFGGEASVPVEEVATVFVVEKDGTVSWVMEPRQDATAPESQPQPVARPPASGHQPPPSTAASPATATTATAPTPSPPEAKPTSPASPTPVAVATGGGKSTGAPTPPPKASADAIPPPSTSPPVPHGKVVLTPNEPLATRLLRWGGAPAGALVALGVVVFFFRRRFHAAQKGVLVEAPLGGEVEVDFSVPSKAWETLTVALEERNFDVYRLCWVLHYSDEDLQPAFEKGLINWKYYDYTITRAEPHPKNKERFYLHIKRSTKFDREDLEERVKRMSLLRTDAGWKFEEVPYGF